MPADVDDVLETCRAIALALPSSAVFSHQTAARLWRLPLPYRLDAQVHITTPTGTRARRGPAITGHQRRLEQNDFTLLAGIRLTSPGRTFTDLAMTLTIVELVALGDAIARQWGAEHLTEAVTRAGSARGIRKLREALSLVDPGAESPKESELRMLLTDARIGPLTSNLNVCTARGQFVARVDLALAHLMIAVEYEGDHHRDRDQWRRDIARRRRLEAEGWVYIPVTQADLRRPARLLSDIRAAIDRRA